MQKKSPCNQRHDAGELGGCSFLAVFGEVSIFPAQKKHRFQPNSMSQDHGPLREKKNVSKSNGLFSFSVYHLHINDLTLVTREKHAK